MGRCLAGAVLSVLLSSAAWAQGPPPSGAEVRKNLDRILSGGEYATLRPDLDPEGTLWARILEKIAQLLGKIAILSQSQPAVFWTILVVCLGLLVAIFVHGGVILVRSLREARAGRTPSTTEETRPQDGLELLARAAGEAREGRYTEAIRSCHRAALVGLDHRGLVRFHESLTSGDYRRQLDPRPRERKSFDALARIYEPAFFGGALAAESDYAESLRLSRMLVGEAAA